MPGNDNLVKIVVVSNDLIMPDFLENMLDPQRFVLETVNPNPKSIARIRKVYPDIVVVDSTESEGDISRICLNIRNYSGTPILVLIADHKPELVEQILDAGADDILIKPVSGSILVAYLNTLTRRARAENYAALSIVNGDDGKGQQARLLTY